MSRELRIVFYGTPQFAKTTLEHIVANGYNVVAVVTAPDRPAGRGRQLKQSEVKKYALKNGIKVLQPTNLKSDSFITELRATKVNLQVVVAFRMMPKTVWEMPEYGTFNLHASLLPQYRGAAPINWAIINGETETGVTTFFIDDKIDTGSVILQEKVNIASDETAGTLHDKLMHTGSELVLKTIKLIENGTVKTRPQGQMASSALKPAPKIFKDTCEIDWHKPMTDIYNKIRGLSPYPGAFTTIINNGDKVTVKIFQVEPFPEPHNLPVGKIIQKDRELLVAVKGGYIKIKELQLAGKRKMSVSDLLNGYDFSENARAV